LIAGNDHPHKNPAGDIGVTVDFSHVIPIAHLDAQVKELKLNPTG
jgi:hypothetical protein